ncbi:MAG: peptide-methionine (S)-S-oxide reductase MsrA [Pseudomonadales bacterium]
MKYPIPLLTLFLLGLLMSACRAEETSPAVPVEALSNAQIAVFAGGCFWCMEPPFDRLPGVIATTSGYAGGTQADPGYKAVTAGGTGHLESVRVSYDPAIVSFDELLHVYWRNVDPVDAGGQFCDRGESYQTAVFVLDTAQRQAAQRSLADISTRFEEPIATKILPLKAAAFYPAEDYHQDYYRKNPLRYKYYRSRCGRDARLSTLWGNPES